LQSHLLSKNDPQSSLVLNGAHLRHSRMQAS
jgi:hypothetical protein